MLSKNLPITQPARIKGFGHPWHGKVTGSALTAGDGTQVSYTQPAAAGKYTAGATNLVQFAGAPGGAGLIAKAGQEWMSYAILAGYARQLYETAIGADKWIYRAPDATNWLVSCPLQGQFASFNAPIDIMITLSLFGVLGGAAQDYAIPASLADIGQPGAIDCPSYDYAQTGALVSIESLSSTGARAILMLSLGVGSETLSNGFFRPIQRRAVGYLQLEITGTPGTDAAVTLTVLRDRDATLGGIEDYFEDPDLYSTFTGDKYAQVLDETYREESGPGYTDQIWTPVAASYVSYTGAPGQVAFADIYSGSGHRKQTGRVIALAFDAIDQIAEWSTDTSYTYSADAPEPIETLVGDPNPERRIRVFDDASPSQQLSTYTRVFERTVTKDEQTSFSLSRGTIVQSWSLTSSRQDSATSEAGPTNTDYTWQITVGGEGGGTFTESGSFSDSTPFIDYTGDPAIAGGLQMNGWTPGAAGGDWASFYYPDVGISSSAHIIRYANNLIGSISKGDYGDSEAAQVFIQSTAASPSDVHTITQLRGTDDRRYGSWNPVTGEAVFAETEAVCWV